MSAGAPADAFVVAAPGRRQASELGAAALSAAFAMAARERWEAPQ